MKIYQVLSSGGFPSWRALNDYVNEALRDGWELAGGVAVDSDGEHLQAMWKEVDDDRESAG